jgi:hypothetical protein
MKRLAFLLLLLPSTSFGVWTIEGGTGDTITKWKKDGALVCYQTITGVWHKANGDSAYYGQGGGGAAWGEITGTLSNQSDLNTALLGKQNTNEKGAANGYPSLDANSKVPTLYLGGSGADNTKYLRGDQTWATPAGGGGGGPASCKKTADQANNTVTYADCSGLSFALTSGTYYHFRFNLIFRTAATTTGIKLGLTWPTATTFSCEGQIPFAADGAGGAWQGHITATTDSVRSTGVQAANTDYFAVLEGTILPSTGGTLQLKFASEVASSAATIRQGSSGLLYTIP